jgi:dTDP-4-dehydrorhamnose 3,5-epimerase
MLPGVAVRPLKKFPDERGSFTEIMRSDWSDIIRDGIVQADYSFSYPGVVRAWHRHERGQVDHFLCIVGSIKICAYDEASAEIDEIVSSGESLQLVCIPGNYWHGFSVVGNSPASLIYFINRLYDPKAPDELRRPWDDPIVIPKLINGRADDPRCGKPWDWHFVPLK